MQFKNVCLGPMKNVMHQTRYYSAVLLRITLKYWFECEDYAYNLANICFSALYVA